VCADTSPLLVDLNLVYQVVFNNIFLRFMKKILGFSLLVIIASIAACTKEIPPTGLVLDIGVVTTDTTYVLQPIDVPAAESKRVLVEEFTGVKCTNCPSGAAIVKGLQTANPGRVVVVKMHSNFLADPIKVSDPDLRDKQADEIDIAFGTNGLKPNAIIDRTKNLADPNQVQYYSNKNSWSNVVTAQLSKSSPINLSCAGTLNAAKDSIELKTKIIFTSASTDTLAYSIYLIEDEIEATQDSFTTTTFEIQGYIHEEVLRKAVTPPVTGTPLPTFAAGYEKGRVIDRIVSFSVPAKVLNKQHLRVVAFIHKQNKGEVLQASYGSIQ
jgi:thiol-disulfide isomerase/thioredoxin